MTQNIFIVILALIIVSCGSEKSGKFEDGHFIPQKPELSLNEADNLKSSADIMRANSPELDQFLSIPALTAVTHEFGPSIISIREFPFKSEVAESSIKPWSSWWYPKKDDFLFSLKNGKYTSALTKYDLIRQKRGSKTNQAKPFGSAADFERKNFNPNDLTWEGLCDAWSLASISKPEPKKPVTMSENGIKITFTISDLKALLLKTYEAVEDSDLKYYGQKFTGDENGWIFPDIFPDQFHRFLETQLFEHKLPFIMDHDPGVEVWNVPVFKANYIIDLIPGQPDSLFVRTWLYSAESVQNNEKEFVGTKEAVREYNYVLVGTRNSQGDLQINSGYWVKGPDGVDSRKDHPDYITRIPYPLTLKRKSWNPEIDILLVDEILSQSY